MHQFFYQFFGLEFMEFIFHFSVSFSLSPFSPFVLLCSLLSPLTAGRRGCCGCLGWGRARGLSSPSRAAALPLAGERCSPPGARGGSGRHPD